MVHLEDEQHILFRSTAGMEEIEEQLKNSEVTQLTAFFMLCLQEKQMYTKDKVPWSRETWEEDFPGGFHKKDGGPPARDILYRDVGK